ncbi:hypothetical protein ACIA74_41665 [Streptomyces sp. NPDC051658]|uniref:hypothetical protein n=1 Tax=Streptomyces sp. NPDC051658 TaxID=3365667 RepID=UPI0037902A2B
MSVGERLVLAVTFAVSLGALAAIVTLVTEHVITGDEYPSGIHKIIAVSVGLASLVGIFLRAGLPDRDRGRRGSSGDGKNLPEPEDYDAGTGWDSD